jgi:hypothetical protein
LSVVMITKAHSSEKTNTAKNGGFSKPLFTKKTCQEMTSRLELV